MHTVRPAEAPGIPRRPQLHSRKHHHSYNGRKDLPLSSWVRSPTIRATQLDGAHTLVYEVVLYYAHNRACTLFRTWDDFCRLRGSSSPCYGRREDDDATVKATTTTAAAVADFVSEDDVEGLHRFLRAALAKRRDDCAVEFFLRRRMEDCS